MQMLWCFNDSQKRVFVFYFLRNGDAMEKWDNHCCLFNRIDPADRDCVRIHRALVTTMGDIEVFPNLFPILHYHYGYMKFSYRYSISWWLMSRWLFYGCRLMQCSRNRCCPGCVQYWPLGNACVDGIRVRFGLHEVVWSTQEVPGLKYEVPAIVDAHFRASSARRW